jgi:hypothetical protein
MKSNYNIGDIAFIVRHCPFWPDEKEVEAFEASGSCIVDVAHGRVEEKVFGSLVRAIAFAKKAAKKDFWKSCEVFEVKLVNPYWPYLADHRVKRSALEWEKLDGGYECDIEA